MNDNKQFKNQKLDGQDYVAEEKRAKAIKNGAEASIIIYGFIKLVPIIIKRFKD